MESLNSNGKTFPFSEVIHFFKIIFTAPATNAILERSFQTSKRVKTLTRSIMSMSNNRLCHLLVIRNYKKELCHHHVTKSKTDYVTLRYLLINKNLMKLI